MVRPVNRIDQNVCVDTYFCRPYSLAYAEYAYVLAQDRIFSFFLFFISALRTGLHDAEYAYVLAQDRKMYLYIYVYMCDARYA